MALDECPKITNDKNIIKQSMDLSLEWALRSKNAFGSNPHKGLFGIVQGGLFDDLRIESLNKLVDINFYDVEQLRPVINYRPFFIKLFLL